jgi:CheY-like chemotaxis protein
LVHAGVTGRWCLRWGDGQVVVRLGRGFPFSEYNPSGEYAAIMTRTALVVDDNRETADGIVKMLTLIGFQARPVYSPRLAIESMSQGLPHLLVLDVHMQGVDGGEVIRFIRRDPRMASVPILAVSSDTQDSIVAGILSAGADAFLPKPVEFDDMEKTVERIIRR